MEAGGDTYRRMMIAAELQRAAMRAYLIANISCLSPEQIIEGGCALQRADQDFTYAGDKLVESRQKRVGDDRTISEVLSETNPAS